VQKGWTIVTLTALDEEAQQSHRDARRSISIVDCCTNAQKVALGKGYNK